MLSQEKKTLGVDGEVLADKVAARRHDTVHKDGNGA